KEHGFQYTEQPMKSFLTPAIYDVTNGSFLQECPINRYEQKQRRTKKVQLGTGHLDYWANYNNCSFLIEVKHYWIRYYPRNNYFKFYSNLQVRLDSAVKQIERMHAKTHYNYRKRLFALCLVVAPIFVRGEDFKKAPIGAI
ncbi:MAG: hypothetical protein Q8M95_06320, partial [Candidatus Methanoperedens sp.]|nr:hypothetical protein [Candidatus Methanoperedens sp.]